MPLDPKGLLLKSAAVSGVDQAIKYVHTIEPNSPANKPGGASDQYIREVYRLYAESGINPELTVAQWAVETGAGTDDLWLERLNPAGLGVTDDRDFGYTWATPAKAARGHVVHLTGYVDGYNRGVRKYLADDPRYLLLLGTDYAGTARTVADLEGTWATDKEYAEKIAWRVEGIRNADDTRPDPPAGDIVFGKCPRPAWVDRQIPDRNNWAWNDLGPRGLRGITYHRMLGTLWGTDGWFRGGGGGSGLTDFGVDNNTGEMLLWNDYLGRPGKGISPNRAGWASGPWENPPGDGRALVAKYGVNAINRDLVSIEIAGNYDSPIKPPAYREIVRLSAYLADQAKIPYTDYPYNPHTGLVFTYTHNEFQNHKACPGHVVLGQVDTIIRETAAYMKIFQTGQK
jgi:hypothetical protein